MWHLVTYKYGNRASLALMDDNSYLGYCNNKEAIEKFLGIDEWLEGPGYISPIRKFLNGFKEEVVPNYVAEAFLFSPDTGAVLHKYEDENWLTYGRFPLDELGVVAFNCASYLAQDGEW